MKKLLTLLVASIAVVLVVANVASAATITPGPLTITYDGDGAVFAEVNFSPGNTVSKALTVTNNGTVAHSFALATQNVSGDLAGNIYIEPVYEGSQVFSKSVYDLANLATESETVVSSISPGATVAVDLRARFDTETGDDLQGKTVSFDFVFGTEEAEPAPVGAFATLGTTFGVPTPTPTASATVSASVTSSPGEVRGEQTQNANDINPYYLLIAPVIALLGAVFLPEFALVAAASLVGGGAAYVLGSRSMGSMPLGMFIALVILEVLALLFISYFLLRHNNRASRKVRGYHHRFRIR